MPSTPCLPVPLVRCCTRFMKVVARRGSEYGLTYNATKLEVLRVRHDCIITAAGGGLDKTVSAMKYLGSLRTADDHIHTELSRRLGMAASDFKVLARVLSHARISRKKKVLIYRAIIKQASVWSPYCVAA